MDKDSAQTSSTPKHAGGRPTKYDPKNTPKLAYAMALAGRTDAQIADFLEVSEQTLNTWKKEHPEFLESLKAGKQEPDDMVERSLFERATGYDNKDAVKIFMPANAEEPVYAPYIEHVVPDVTAQIFWLKNRRPDRWRDRQEITGRDGGPIEIHELNQEERAARIAELLAKAKA